MAAIATTAHAGVLCTVIADAGTRKVLMREGGGCNKRITAASTFKIAISLMGYDAGFLIDEHTPALPFREGYPDWLPEWRRTTDPAGWIKYSVVWFSQQVTASVGERRFQHYVSAFHYGNEDVSGNPGKHDGLAEAWLSSSLKISPLEQVSFLEKVVNRQLPVRAKAYDMTSRITEIAVLPNGWDVHGKTGSGTPKKADGTDDEDHGYGWFVGWAMKDGRTVVFARLIQDDKKEPVRAGLRARADFLAAAPALLDGLPAAAPADCPHCSAWTAHQKPFRVYGNTYYVGTRELSSILIVSPKGHILIDGTVQESASQIVGNIKELGFRIADVRLILNSHVHFDHAGGIAELQRASGAEVAASAQSARVLVRGHTDSDDPQFGLHSRGLTPIEHVRVIEDGEVLDVGPLKVTAHLTPGHTPGGTSWSWQSCEERRCLNVVYADSLSPVSAEDFQFSHNSAYPTVLQDFAKSFAVLDTLPCDILLTPHPGASDTLERLQRRDSESEPDAFIAPDACRQYAAASRATLTERVEHEQHPGHR
jgi:beta-lactamase class D